MKVKALLSSPIKRRRILLICLDIPRVFYRWCRVPVKF